MFLASLKARTWILVDFASAEAIIVLSATGAVSNRFP